MAPLPRSTIPGMRWRSSRTAANRFWSNADRQSSSVNVAAPPSDCGDPPTLCTMMSTPRRPVQRLGTQCPHPVGGADVGDDHVVSRLRGGHRTRRHHDGGAAGTQPVGDRPADAASPSGDQCPSAGEFVVIDDRHAFQCAVDHRQHHLPVEQFLDPASRHSAADWVCRTRRPAFPHTAVSPTVAGYAAVTRGINERCPTLLRPDRGSAGVRCSRQLLQPGSGE